MPTAYRVIVLPEAFGDLDRITEFIKHDSPQNAAAMLERLWKATQTLSLFPHRYRVREHRRDPSKAVRSMPVPPFVMYYRIDNALHAVRVLTIRHGRQKQPRRFR
jgi:plasmid stabilization system protein ParE